MYTGITMCVYMLTTDIIVNHKQIVSHSPVVGGSGVVGFTEVDVFSFLHSALATVEI